MCVLTQHAAESEHPRLVVPACDPIHAESWHPHRVNWNVELLPAHEGVVLGSWRVDNLDILETSLRKEPARRLVTPDRAKAGPTLGERHRHAVQHADPVPHPPYASRYAGGANKFSRHGRLMEGRTN